MADLNEGAAWTLGVAGATRYPTDKQGAATATNTSSFLFDAGMVQIIGYTVTATPGAGATVTFVNHAGSALTGLALPATAVGCYQIGGIGDGVRYSDLTITGKSNVGIACSAGVTAIMHWRKLS